MIKPGTDEILDSVIAAIEGEIAPAVTDEYAASLCRTVAQMLRHVRVRWTNEGPALVADNAELRALLQELATGPELREVVGELPAVPEPVLPTRDDLVSEAEALRAALVAVIEAVPHEADPVRVACRDYLGAQLRRQLPWQQDAYTGPRR